MVQQNINNINYNMKHKIRIKKDICDNGDFSLSFPPELYPYISTQDYCSIVAQLNHYRKGHPNSMLYNGVGFFFYSILIFFIILFRTSLFAIVFILPLIFVFSITHLILLFRFKKNFYNEVRSYIELLNRLYTNLTFGGIFITQIIQEVEITISNTIVISSSNEDSLTSSPPPPPPINKYNHSVLCGFKYLVKERQQPFIQYYYNTNITSTQNQNQNQNLNNIISPIYNNNSSNNNNNNNRYNRNTAIDISIDLNSYQYQPPYIPSFQPQLQPQQMDINANEYNENRRPTIQELLIPSDAEKYYTTITTNK